MPSVSGNAWKLLCLIARQTDGWNREEIGLSYRDLIVGMGVSSRATVAAAIKELEPLNLLVVKVGRSQWEEARYSLNLETVIEWEPVNFGELSVTKTVTGSKPTAVTEIVTEKPVTEVVPVTKTVTAPVTEIVTVPVTEIVPLYRKKQEKQGKQLNPLTAAPFHTDESAEEDQQSAATDSMTSLLCQLHGITEQSGWRINEQYSGLAMQLVSIGATVEQVNAFWEFRKVKPQVHRFVADFATWRATQNGAAAKLKTQSTYKPESWQVGIERE